MDPGLLVALIMTGAILLGVGITILILRPRGKLGQTVVSPGETFYLKASPGNSRSHKLWLRYSIAWTGKKYDYGLLFSISVKVDGQEAVGGEFGMGRGASVRGLSTIMPTKVYSSSGRHGSLYYEKATVALCQTGPRRKGSIIEVEGSIEGTDSTDIESLEVYLAR